MGDKNESSRVGTFVVPTRNSVPMARGHKTNAHPTGLTQTLYRQMAESEKLDAVIRRNLEELGYGQ